MTTKIITKKSPTIFPYRGKWRIQYFDSEGRIRTKTAESQKDAYKDLAILEQLIASGRLPKRLQDLPTLGDWLQTWVEGRKGEIREITRIGFEASIRLHIIPALGSMRIDQVTTFQVEQLYKKLMKEKALSPATIHRIHALLKHSFGLAMRYGFIKTNPMQYVKVPKKETPRIEALTLDEINAILSVARNKGDVAYLRWLLALRLGMRQGECLALTLGDVNLAQGTISITKSLNTLPGQGFVISPPKSEKSNRLIPVDTETQRALAAVLQGRFMDSPDSLIFQTANGEPVDAKNDYTAWQSLLRMAGVRKQKLHAARHGAATLMVALGVDIRSIQLILGHSSPSFTLATYVHPNQATLRAALQKVEVGSAQIPGLI